MDDLTPHGMLKLYRQEGSDFTIGQLKKFREMPLDDRLELLFHMIIHATRGIQMLHDKIEPGAAPTIGMPSSETEH